MLNTTSLAVKPNKGLSSPAIELSSSAVELSSSAVELSSFIIELENLYKTSLDISDAINSTEQTLTIYTAILVIALSSNSLARYSYIIVVVKFILKA